MSNRQISSFSCVFAVTLFITGIYSGVLGASASVTAANSPAPADVIPASSNDATPLTTAPDSAQDPTKQLLKPTEDVMSKPLASIMFSGDDIDSVNTVLRAIASGPFNKSDDNAQDGSAVENTKDMLDEILNSIPKIAESGEVVQKSITYPSFFLSSIVYSNANDWAVWLNGNRIQNRQNNVKAPIYISEITPEFIQVVWKPSKMVLAQLGSIAVQQKDREGMVPIDIMNNTLTFRLKPNQTFVSGILSVQEGRLPSVTVNLSSEESKQPSTAEAMHNSSPPAIPTMAPYGQPPMGATMPQPQYQGAKQVINDAIGKISN
jgi:hypothetical protein